MNNIKFAEIAEKAHEPISLNQIDLVQVKLVAEPKLPHVYIDLPEDGNRPSIFLDIDNEISDLKSTRIDLVPGLLFNKIPPASIELSEILLAARSAHFDTQHRFLEYTCSVLVKGAARLTIERPVPWNDEVKFTLSIGGFEAEGSCSISNLAGLIDPTPTETEEEAIARYEEKMA